jgi:hypothetical protein
MWSLFVISYVIYDWLPASKVADFLFYLTCFIALPITGYVALYPRLVLLIQRERGWPGQRGP